MLTGGLLLSGVAHAQPAPAVHTLTGLLERARLESPALATSRAEQLSARAGLITARALPNPEVAIEPGHLGARRGDTAAGSSLAVSVIQPLPNPWLRE